MRSASEIFSDSYESENSLFDMDPSKAAESFADENVALPSVANEYGIEFHGTTTQQFQENILSFATAISENKRAFCLSRGLRIVGAGKISESGMFDSASGATTTQEAPDDWRTDWDQTSGIYDSSTATAVISETRIPDKIGEGYNQTGMTPAMISRIVEQSQNASGVADCLRQGLLKKPTDQNLNRIFNHEFFHDLYCKSKMGSDRLLYSAEHRDVSENGGPNAYIAAGYEYYVRDDFSNASSTRGLFELFPEIASALTRPGTLGKEILDYYPRTKTRIQWILDNFEGDDLPYCMKGYFSGMSSAYNPDAWVTQYYALDGIKVEQNNGALHLVSDNLDVNVTGESFHGFFEDPRMNLFGISGAKLAFNGTLEADGEVEKAMDGSWVVLHDDTTSAYDVEEYMEVAADRLSLGYPLADMEDPDRIVLATQADKEAQDLDAFDFDALNRRDDSLNVTPLSKEGSTSVFSAALSHPVGDVVHHIGDIMPQGIESVLEHMAEALTVNMPHISPSLSLVILPLRWYLPKVKYNLAHKKLCASHEDRAMEEQDSLNDDVISTKKEVFNKSGSLNLRQIGRDVEHDIRCFFSMRTRSPAPASIL